MYDPRTNDKGDIDSRDWDSYKDNSFVHENSNGTYTDRSTGHVYWSDGTLKE